MFESYNPYNSYYNYTNFTQPNSQQLARSNAYKPQGVLQGKVVDGLDVVKATDIPYDGSVSYFPLIDNSAIITKQLQADGTSKIVVYKPEVGEVESNPKYITEADLKEQIKNVNSKDIKDLKDEIKTIHSKEIKGIRDEIKNINSKEIKDIKEDIKNLKRAMEDIADDLIYKKED